MELKEFRPPAWGARVPRAPLDPPLILNHDSSQFNLAKSPVANPGFRRRGSNLWVCGKKPIIWQEICQKLSESEKNLTEGDVSLETNYVYPMT